MSPVPASIQQLKTQYPRRDVQTPSQYAHVKAVMTGIPGTPCCVQMSHTFNLNGILIPSSSYRRRLPQHTVGGKTFSYFLAVDEFEEFLSGAFGDPIVFNAAGGSAKGEQAIKSFLDDRPGVILFRYAPPTHVGPPGQFEHIELWDGSQIYQRDMNEHFLFARPRVLFWDSYETRWRDESLEVPLS